MRGCVAAAVAYTQQSKRIEGCVKQEMCKNRFYELSFLCSLVSVKQMIMAITGNIKIHSWPEDDQAMNEYLKDMLD